MYGRILYYKEWKKGWTREVKADINIDIPIDEISYIHIKYTSKNYTIKNPKIITEIIQLINDEPVTYTENYQKHSKLYTYIYAVTPKYEIYIYSEDKCVASLSIGSETISYGGKSYNLTNKGGLRKKIDDIASYCEVNLMQIGYKINKFETSGIEISQNEAVDEYNSMLGALPIKESEFKTSDVYYFINTYSDEDIYVYYVGDEKYIKYQKSYTLNVSEDSEDIPEELLNHKNQGFFKISSQNADN